MTKKLHILFLCSWFPSKEFPTNGDFIQRHAKAISLKHSVSVLHIVSSKQNAKTTIEKSVEKNVTTYIGYVKHTKNPILIWYKKRFSTILSRWGTIVFVTLNLINLIRADLLRLHNATGGVDENDIALAQDTCEPNCSHQAYTVKTATTASFTALTSVPSTPTTAPGPIGSSYIAINSSYAIKMPSVPAC